MTKEIKKRRRLKVVFTITAICTIFSLLTVSCFAYQSGIPYRPNVYTGDNSYLYHPIERMTYITRTATNAYTKDIPVSNSFSVYNSPGWVDFGEPLAENATSQTTYGYEVTTGIINPHSVSSSVNWDITSLGSDYSPYYTGGVLDAVRYQITINRNYGTPTQTYQRAIIGFADVYIPNPITHETIRRATDPQLRMWKPTGMSRGAIYSLRCTITGRSSLDGKIHSQDIALNDEVDNTPEATAELYDTQYNIYALNVYRKLADLANDELQSCNYWHLSNLTVVLGKQQYDISFVTADLNGFSFADIYLPSVRPYDRNRADTPDEIYDVRSPYLYDVNFLRDKMGQDDLSGYTSTDLEISSVGTFVSQITRGFLDIYIIPGISLGGILFTCLAIGFIVVVLRYFAGG